MILKDSPKHLKHIPVQIVQRMVDLAEQQGGKVGVDMFDDTFDKWFLWKKSPEGYDFWDCVLVDGDHEKFFSLYPPIIEADLVGDIERFPVRVVQRMCEHQVNQGFAYDPTAFRKCKTVADPNGFVWFKTPEGADFWERIINGLDFQYFDTDPIHELIKLPMIMEVSDDWKFDNNPPIYRLVVAEIPNGFVCFDGELKEFDGKREVRVWRYARTTRPVEKTMAEIEKELLLPPGVLRIV